MGGKGGEEVREGGGGRGTGVTWSFYARELRFSTTCKISDAQPLHFQNKISP